MEAEPSREAVGGQALWHRRVHGEIGYVVQEQRLARYGTIKSPVGLLYYALEKRLINSLPAPPLAKEEEEQVDKVYPPVPAASGRGLGNAIWDWVDARAGGALAKMFRSSTQLELERGVLYIRSETRWHADNIANRKGLFKEAVSALFGTAVDFEITIDSEQH